MNHKFEFAARDEYFKAAFFVAILTGVIFSLSGVYNLQKLVQLKQEISYLLRGTISLILISLVSAFFYREFSFSRIHTIYFFICLIILLFFSRIFARMYLKFLHTKKGYVQNVLLIGSGKSAKNFCQNFQQLLIIQLNLKTL